MLHVKNYLNNFLLILVTIVWGSTFVIIKGTVDTGNEAFIVFGRIFLATIPMLLFILLKNGRRLLNKKDFINGSILGFLLTIIYLSQTIGLKYTSSGHSAFITGGAIILVPVILFSLFKEKFYKSDILSICTVVLGLFLLTYDYDTDFNIGDVITFITAISAAFHIVLSGRFVKKTEAILLIFHQFMSASIFSLIYLLIVGFEMTSISSDLLLATVYLGVIGTLFCYFVSIWIQKHVSSVKVVLFFSLEPVFAVFFGYIILNERLNMKEIFGMFLILFGVFLYQILRNNYISIFYTRLTCAKSKILQSKKILKFK